MPVAITWSSLGNMSASWGPDGAASSPGPIELTGPGCPPGGGFGGSTGGGFGASIAAYADTLVASGSQCGTSRTGRLYVFKSSDGAWTDVDEISGTHTAAGDGFGRSVAISGNVLVVGSDGASSFAGRAYVFADTGKTWSQVAELQGSDTTAGDLFGSAVGVSGSTIAVGAPGAGSRAGRVYLYTGTSGVWHQSAELTPSVSQGESGINNEGQFGWSLAISRSTLVVGSWAAEAGEGRAYVFSKMGPTWHQSAELTSPGRTALANFGESVGVSGNTIVVGAPGSSRAYVFHRTAGGWSNPVQLKGSDTVADDDFGGAVAVSGSQAVVGANVHGTHGGRTYIFVHGATGWHQIAELAEPDGHAGDRFGSSVTLSNHGVVVGAPDAPATGSTELSTPGPGRVYVFRNPSES